MSESKLFEPVLECRIASLGTIYRAESESISANIKSLEAKGASIITPEEYAFRTINTPKEVIDASVGTYIRLQAIFFPEMPEDVVVSKDVTLLENIALAEKVHHNKGEIIYPGSFKKFVKETPEEQYCMFNRGICFFQTASLGKYKQMRFLHGEHTIDYGRWLGENQYIYTILVSGDPGIVEAKDDEAFIRLIWIDTPNSDPAKIHMDRVFVDHYNTVLGVDKQNK